MSFKNNELNQNMMKNCKMNIETKLLKLVVVSLLVFMGIPSQAQRVVVRPRTTTVVTPNKTIVVRKPAVRVVPREARVVRYGNVSYHVHGGVYYRPVAGGYAVVRPPLGFRLRVLPVGYRSFVVGRRIYYYYGGVYYIKINGEYEVVKAPANSVITVLPAGYKTVTIDGNTYYLHKGNYYEKLTSENGEVTYNNIGSTL